MWDKVIVLSFSALSSIAVIVSMQMHSWILTTGMSQKRFGLLKVEILGCGAGAHNGGNAAAAVLSTMSSAGCHLATSESQEGEMSYAEYTFNTCSESTKPQCALANTVPQLDVGGWSGCSILKERCTSFQKIARLNWGLWWSLAIAVIINSLGAALAWKDSKYGIAGAIITMIIIFAVLSLTVISEGDYHEPPPLSATTTYGTGFWAAFLSLGLTILQTFIGCCIYKDGEEADEERKKEEKKKAKKQKKDTDAETQSFAVKAYGDNQDYMTMTVSKSLRTSGQQIADQTFGTVLEAIRQRGYTDVAQAFRVFDLDGNGYISVEEFKQASDQMGFTLTQEQVQWLISQFDPNRDGHLDYPEFSLQVQRWAQTVGQV